MAYFLVDESGNLGYVFETGSSRLFVLVLLKVGDPEVLRDFVRRMRVARHLPEDYEFKYRRVGSRRVLCEHFFRALAQLEVAIWALVVDKTRRPPGLMALDRAGFYGWALGEIMAVMPEAEVQGAVVVLDEPNHSGRFLSDLRVHLSRVWRGLGWRAGFRKITGHDSARDAGLQCADMVAGAVADHVSGHDSTAYRMIAGKFVTTARRP